LLSISRTEIDSKLIDLDLHTGTAAFLEITLEYTMDLNYSAEDLAFRIEVRAFIKENLPEKVAYKVKNKLRIDKKDYVCWEKILASKGWSAINWPVEHGGTGWTPTQKYIFSQECGQAGAPDIVAFGMHMVAPVIYTYGNEEQKQRFLPDIRNSNVWWCQGYSEANAGSDLASLKTTAVREGDHFVINGSKTWTTYAQYADWIFCLVRTGDKSVKNQQAISFLLIDMKTPGISVNPIHLLDEYHEVNEVFFDNVQVPANNLIGEEGQGWTYAKLLLTHERTISSNVPKSKTDLKEVKIAAAQTNHFGFSLMEDSNFCQKLTKLEIDLMALEFTELRILADMSTGKVPGPESSVLKLRGTQIAQKIDELRVEVAGYYALPFVEEQFTPDYQGPMVGPNVAANSASVYFNFRKSTIYGGSTEVQKNIIAKAVLGL
jgi:alkylation response protein AidB-like acyl-CoA dehydrogenase